MVQMGAMGGGGQFDAASAFKQERCVQYGVAQCVGFMYLCLPMRAGNSCSWRGTRAVGRKQRRRYWASGTRTSRRRRPGKQCACLCADIFDTVGIKRGLCYSYICNVILCQELCANNVCRVDCPLFQILPVVLMHPSKIDILCIYDINVAPYLGLTVLLLPWNQNWEAKISPIWKSWNRNRNRILWPFYATVLE